jgi:hypothetical protein
MNPQTIQERLDNDYTYHAPTPEQVDVYTKIRATAKAFAELVANMTPASREQSIALTNIEAAVMYANAAVARHS